MTFMAGENSFSSLPFVILAEPASAGEWRALLFLWVVSLPVAPREFEVERSASRARNPAGLLCGKERSGWSYPAAAARRFHLMRSRSAVMCVR